MAGGFTLQLLHMSDGEGSTLTPTTAPIMGALIDRFDNQYANTLVLAGGDNFIPGPFLTAGADPSLNPVVGGATVLGRPDLAIYNAFGVRASTVGNHEFDLGSATFQAAYATANFPYLSANLDFSGDTAIRGSVVSGGQDVDAIRGRIAPSAIVTVGGERIGLVGATTQVLERISSPTGTEVRGFPLNGQPGDNLTERDDMALLASQLQPVIDALVAQGVTRIVLQSHLQLLSNEIALAPLLRNVDIILAAGSHTRLGDATDVPGAFPGHDANFAGTYPIATAGADGNPTLIVNTDSESTYLGRLVVTFDAEGRIIPASLNPAINGAYASNQTTLQAAYGADIGQAFAPGSIGARVQQITGAVDNVIRTKEGNVYGFTDVYLEGDRTLGRSEETNLGNLTADANAAAAATALPNQPFIVSLKNGGGIRASIGSVNAGGGNDPNAGAKGPPAAVPGANKPEGAISQLDTENALRFDNRLMVFDTTPQGLLNILNYGAGLAPGNGGFPQIGGVQFSYDPSLPAGQRVRNVALVDEDDRVIARVVENGRIVADAPATISVVTLNFTANG
ncbi:MAG TPA: 5'-nucleotidase C-terminal domain-containing protein, partial [Methylobacterium sp.]